MPMWAIIIFADYNCTIYANIPGTVRNLQMHGAPSNSLQTNMNSSAIIINCMIKVLALISVCCRTCSSEQLPLCKIHRGKLPIPVTLVHVYICYLFSSIPNNTGPWIKKQGNTIKNNYCLETKKHLRWVLIETSFSTQNKCLDLCLQHPQ